jgi:molybdopterin synthase sulfur carrier subunit
MPHLAFTANLQRHVSCPPCDVAGETVREALEEAFQRYPRARGYVLDEHGALRHHMAIFINGLAIEDRRHLSDPVAPDGEIFVMQALSGG